MLLKFLEQNHLQKHSEKHSQNPSLRAERSPHRFIFLEIDCA
jgi:hypothetical protein